MGMGVRMGMGMMVQTLLQVIQKVISKVDLNRKNPRIIIIMGIEVHLTDSQKPYLHPNKGEHKVVVLVVVTLVIVLAEEEDHKADVAEVPGNNSNIYSNMPRLKQQLKQQLNITAATRGRTIPGTAPRIHKSNPTTPARIRHTLRPR